MALMESVMFMAALISVGLSALFYAWHFLRARRIGIAGGAQGAGAVQVWEPGRFATMMAVLAMVFLTLSMVFRWVLTGHGPFSNMYEFSLAFTWGIVGALLYFEGASRSRMLGALVAPIALALLIYAYTQPSRALPLVPALQQSLLLSVHVAVAIIAYGAFALGFGVAILYLVQRRQTIPWLPSPAMLDDLGYRSVIMGFPFMTLTIVLGALWADIAWGRYWGWDPKETASLVTWLIYGGYLHARLVAGWKGGRAAALLLLGFAAVLFTYFGNYFLGGLHAYR